MGMIITYPHLYISETAGDGTMDSQGDQTVDGLYQQDVAGQTDIRSMNYRLKIIDCGLRLFGERFDEWVKKQLALPDMGGVNHSFLRDTLKFIHTGERRMHPLTWRGILGSRGSASPSLNTHLRNQDLQLGELSTVNALQLWCSKNNGVSDLLLSMYAIFGPADDVQA